MDWRRMLLGAMAFTICFLIVWGGKLALKAALISWAANR